MTKKVFFSFCMLLAVGMAFIEFNSCSSSASSKKDNFESDTTDLGVVINGVKWATRNVAAPGKFATSPEDAGMFYQWNKIVAWEAKFRGVWDNNTMHGDTWARQLDPSPDGWRTPAVKEITMLLDADKVSSEWTTVNGIAGREFTDKVTGNSIFLPAAGFLDNTNFGVHSFAGSIGFYWSRTSRYDSDNSAYAFAILGDGIVMPGSNRSCGFSVRPVEDIEVEEIKVNEIFDNFMEEADEEPVYPESAIDKEAQFPGGIQAMMEFITKNMIYPEEAKDKGIQGRVFVRFIVETDGSISEIEVMRGIEELNDEAIRIIKSMPKWQPGKVEGNAVRNRRTVPVLFRLYK